jgi:GntR family transcriptional regulator
VILIDYKDARPIYEQIVDRLRQLILNGVLNKDEKIPSVRSLAMELSINPNTIQRAYNELERQGCIYTVKGRGNYVSDPEGLKSEYRSEIFRRLDDVCDVADKAGIKTSELIDHIKSNTDSKKEGGQS